MILPQWERKQPRKLVFIAFHSLKSQSNLFTELRAIARAKVPLVKFLHIPTRRYCDVSFRSPQGVRNSLLLAFLLHLDPRVLSVAIIIKFWAKVHKLTGTNFMPNYALILLVVFYFQQVHILPSVYDLQAKLEPHQQCIVDHWETGFVHIPEYTPRNKKNELGLYAHLAGFFEFYSSYDFAMNIVSVFLGCSIKRELFKRINTVPTAFRLYDTNLHNGLVQPLRIYESMCIQDPFNHSRNCAVAVSKNLFPRIITCLKHAYKCYKEESSNTFLKAILTVVPKLQSPVQQEIKLPPKKKPRTSTPIPKVEPVPIPQLEPDPIAKMEPVPNPNVEPALIPKVEPIAVTKVEPAPIPKVEPVPIPEVKPIPISKMKSVPIPKVNNLQKAGFNFIQKFNELHNQNRHRKGKRKNKGKLKTT